MPELEEVEIQKLELEVRRCEGASNYFSIQLAYHVTCVHNKDMNTATAKRISLYLIIGFVAIAAELSALFGMVL